jgi:cellulase (glycosyl hydrolase family 5)
MGGCGPGVSKSESDVPQAGLPPGRRMRPLVGGAMALMVLLLWVVPTPSGRASLQARAQAPTPLPVGFSQGVGFPETFEPRWNFASAYFPPDDQVVLFGGAPTDLKTTNWRKDTWLFSGGTWQGGPSPPAGLTYRAGAAMAYHPGIGRIVMFGGEARAADGSEIWPPYTNDTWLWDGSSWAKGPDAPPGLAGRTGAQMVYDDAQGEIVLFGGSGLLRYTDTWLFDGARWTRGPDAPPAMKPRVFFGMAYDKLAGKVVVGGGDGTSDVWLFDGNEWAPGPSFPDEMLNNGRERTQMAYNPQLRAVMLFGGVGPHQAQEEIYYLRTSERVSTWEQIPQRPPIPGAFSPPDARMDGAVVWVPTLDAMMFFGGFISGFEGRIGFTDTWFFRDIPPQVDQVTIGPDPPPPGQGLDASIGQAEGGYMGTRVSIRWAVNGIVIPGAKERHLEPVWLLGDLIQAQVRLTDDVGVTGTWVSSNIVTIELDPKSAPEAGPRGRVRASDQGPQARGPDGFLRQARVNVPRRDAGPDRVENAGQRGGDLGACSSPTPGQIVACHGGFWQDGEEILLHGINVSGIAQDDDMTRRDYERIAALHMNVVRMRIGWAQFEPEPPTQNVNGTWTHHYKTGLVEPLMQQIQFAREEGLAVLVESRCLCGNGWPLWLGDADYNSHHRNYDLHNWNGRQNFNTAYWSDSLLQKFTKDWAKTLAMWTGRADGILGYEPLVEPSAGWLPANHETTQIIMDFQLELAEAVREVDPNRVIFFTTRGSSGVGILDADLSGWVSLGNVSFDTHDFFGGRWGSGLDQTGDPGGPVYGESAQFLFNFTLNTNMPPYLGTTEGQARFVETFTDRLAPTGIPLFVAEFAGNTDGEPPDPNILSLFGTMTQAMSIEGVSWAALSYDGYHGLYNPDFTLRPWGPILCEAAAYPEIVTDCPEAG